MKPAKESLRYVIYLVALQRAELLVTRPLSKSLFPYERALVQLPLQQSFVQPYISNIDHLTMSLLLLQASNTPLRWFCTRNCKWLGVKRAARTYIFKQGDG
jgi:hypothetical protein